MDSEIDGREVWVVTVGAEPDGRQVGVYSTEGRAEAARMHLRQADPDAPVTVGLVRVDAEVVG